MTLAEYCVFGALSLYLATIGIAKFGDFRRYDNAKPRDPGFYREGWRARTLAAHQNGAEGFAFFAAAVLLAEFKAAPQGRIDDLAIAFLVIRVAYVAAYIANFATLRTLIWSAGLAVNGAIFFSPLMR